MIDLKGLKRHAKTDYIGARIDEETKGRLETIAKRESVSVSSLIAELIREFLKNYKGDCDGNS